MTLRAVAARRSTTIGSVVPGAPAPGDLWWNLDDVKLYLWDGAEWVVTVNTPEVTGGAGGGGLPEAPTDGRIYGRNGQLTTWVAALPIAGGTLTGSVQVSPPSTAPNQIFLTPTNPANAAIPQGAQFSSFMVSQTTGGDFYDQYCNIRADTTIQGNGSTGINGILSQMTYNGYGGSGGYVPVYGQMSRSTVNAGGSAQNPQIWGAVFEVIDWTNTDSAGTNHMSGIEIDMTCGNTDSAQNRRALGIYLNPANSTDVAPVCHLGFHISANQGSFDQVIAVNGLFNEAVLDLRNAAASSPAGNAIWLGPNGTIAMDTAASVTLSGDASGGIFMTSTAGHPARIIYQPNGTNPASPYWSGAWADGNFYISGPGGNALVLQPSGVATLGGAVTIDGPLTVTVAPPINSAIDVSSLFVQAGLDLRNATASTTAAHHIWLGNAGTVALDTNASVVLYSDVTGGVIVQGASGQPARLRLRPSDGTLHSYWLGAWPDNNFYIGDDTSGTARVTIGPTGAMSLNTTSLGFFNATPIGKPTITGSRTDGTALASLLTELVAYGLVTDSSTP